MSRPKLLIGLALSALLLAVALTAGRQARLLGLPLWAVALGAMLAFGLGLLERARGASLASLFAPRDARYRALLRRAQGDRALAERLMEHERRALPAADRETLAQRALERWERDRR